VHTVWPVTAFEEHALTMLGVAIDVGEPPPSMGTTWMPLVEHPQQPFGTYAVTFVPTATANELEGMQAASVFVLLVTMSVEQVRLVKAGLLSVTQTA